MNFLYANIAFFVIMVLVFTIMFKYYHWVNKDSLLWKITEYPFKAIAAVFIVLDVLWNYYSSLWFFDLPAAWGETFSFRMKRYIDSSNIWKRNWALMMRFLLNYSDPGHI